MSTQSNGNNLLLQGRLVWITGSSIFEGKQKTDYNTNAPIFGADGSPTMEYGFGLAIPKLGADGQQHPEFTKLWAALHNEAYTLYPDGNIPPGFAMKFKDGDGIDHNGKKFSEREGHAGHLILTCTTQLPVKFFEFIGGNNVMINTGIKNGDYVNVQINLKAHPAKGNGKAGLYVNPAAVQLIQAGAAIINSPSGDSMFGNTAPAYQGAVVADQGAPMPMVGQAPVAPVAAAPTPAAPALPSAAPAAPAVAQPHVGVLPPQHQAAAQAPATPTPPVGFPAIPTV